MRFSSPVSLHSRVGTVRIVAVKALGAVAADDYKIV